MHKLFCGRGLGEFTGYTQTVERTAHLWQIGYAGKRADRRRCGLRTGAPQATGLPYVYRTPGVIGRACGSGERGISYQPSAWWCIKMQPTSRPPPRWGGRIKGIRVPRVPLRPPCGGLRSTRG